MDQSVSKKGVTGAIWATVDRFGSMVIQFVVNLILARLLVPEDFGIIGMLAIFITVSQTLIDGGFGSALIQKKEPTQTDFSTIFYWNLIFSAALYLILFFAAPFIAKFFNMALIKEVLRVIALSLIINGVVTIQRTRLQKILAFRTITLVNLSSYIAGASVGILLAVNDFGVWSLVWMQLIYGLCSAFLFMVAAHWRPSMSFSSKSMKELFGFGGYLMLSNILQNICLNIQGVIIGKKFSATQMGYYSQAYKLDQVTSYSIPQVIVQVMYPIYSSLQDDTARLKAMVLMNIRVIAFLVFPILSVLIIIAKPLIVLLYGAKWLAAAPYFRIFCVGGFFVSLQNLNFYAVAAVGKSKALFNWSFYKWGFLLTALFIGMNFGMDGILWGMVISGFNIFITNAFLAQRHTGLTVSAQLYALLPVFMIVCVCLGVGFAVNYIFDQPFISGAFTLIFYVCLAALFRLQAFSEAKNILKKIIKTHDRSSLAG